MAKLKLVNPEDFKPSQLQKAAAVGGVVAGLLSVPLIGPFASIGGLLYQLVRRENIGYGKVELQNEMLSFTAGEDCTEIPFGNIVLAEFYFYDGNAEGFEQKFPGPTLLIYHGDTCTVSHTIEDKRSCAHFLKALYDSDIPLRDYTYDRRSYLLKHPKYKEIQALKTKYGADFW